MKILIINDNGIEVGGVETYLSHLKTFLKDQGHTVIVLTSKPFTNSDEYFADEVFTGVNPQSLFRLFPYVFNISALIKLNKVLKEFKPDVVHIHYFFYHTSPSILLALKNTPTVMTLHAHELLAPTGVNYRERICNHPFIGYCINCCGIARYYPEKLKRIILKYLKNAINLYISPSTFYKKLYEKNGFSPIVYLVNGILTAKDLKPLDIKKINYTLLYVGRLAKEKGVIYIIKALPEVLKLFPTVHLNIVGTGEDESRLKQLVKHMKLNEQITFIGKVNNKDAKNFYINSDLVIVPSTYPDNLPTVCIEAMKFGKPIIASNIGGIPDLVMNNKNGYLVEPKNSLEIANKIIDLFRQPNKLQNFRLNSYEMSRKYLLNTHVNKLVDIYKGVIKNGKK